MLRHYASSDRQRQLRELISAIGALSTRLRATGLYKEENIRYAVVVEQAKSLLESGFVQEELSELSRQVPVLFWRHKEWSPPLECGPGGTYREPDWFEKLEPLERRVINATDVLRQLGKY